MSGQPTAADRAVYDCVIDWDKDGHTSVGLDAITRHAAQAAAEREAQVIAAVVQHLRKAANEAKSKMGEATLPTGRRNWASALATAEHLADAIERGDWKRPRNAE